MTDQASTVDWGKPLEAVHRDGRVKVVTFINHDALDGVTRFRFADGRRLWADTDTGVCGDLGWTVRNRQPTPPPIPPEVATKAIEAIRAWLVDNPSRPREWRDAQLWDSFRAVVALLPEPVAPDLVEAEKVAASFMNVPEELVRGHRGSVIAVEIAQAAIRRGRELEREGGA